MRTHLERLRLVLLLAGVLLASGGLVVGVLAQGAQTSLDHTLRIESEEHTARVKDYFERARDVMLLSAQNPAFQNFYAAPGTRTERLRDQPELMDELHRALQYFHVLYPGRIGEACFIDSGGAENARVVGADAAKIEDLSPDESKNPFFKPTLELAPGQVFQARPYVSPDTHEWVISNSTPVPDRTGKTAAILHFEVTMESMRRGISPDRAQYMLQIIDRTTGDVVLDSRFGQRIGAPLGRPADRSMSSVAKLAGSEGLTTVGGQRAFYSVVTPSLDNPVAGAQAVNENDWVLVVAAPAPSGAWSGPFTLGPLILVVAGLLILVMAGLGYRRHHGQLFRRARTDDLTGLPNRLGLREALAEMVADSTDRVGAVLLLDLDRFKIINDTLGHDAGDQLLAETANRLRRALEMENHLVARLGGDEFVVLLRNMPDEQEVVRVANRLQKAVRDSMILNGMAVAISTCIGIAFAPRHGESPARLLHCADVAMYHAKRTGNDHSAYRPEYERHSPARLELEVALLGAIDRGEFVLHYQPAIDAATGQARRVEALVRWDRPEVGLVSPASFLPVVEEIGMMHDLTRHILQIALDQCTQWRAEGFDLQVAVNLSAENCMDTELPGEIAQMLSVRGLPASVLWLEITEHSALAPQAGQVLAHLRRLGIGLALDDFGTGFSSLSYVRSLPIDEIKIDRSFVAAIERDQSDTVIVRAAVAMAHGLGQSVTAEGAENGDSMRVLTELGVDAIQGYHVCRPLPAGDLAPWLRLHHRSHEPAQSAPTGATAHAVQVPLS